MKCTSSDKKHMIFKNGGGQILADRSKVPFLGELPLATQVVESGDAGEPIVVSNPESQVAIAYKELAGKIAAQLSIEQARGDKAETTFELAWEG